jgi:hypothetical protein
VFILFKLYISFSLKLLVKDDKIFKLPPTIPRVASGDGIQTTPDDGPNHWSDMGEKRWLAVKDPSAY